ncbi:MAG: NAD(P)-dependent oxidoreductase [Flavobacteriaceae bacterium]
MNILIIGATGKTGRQLVKQSLEKGYTVTALVRKPDKLKEQHPNLIIVQGDVLDPASIDHVMPNQDAVLCALGHKRFFLKTDILSKGTANIIHSMNTNGVRRLICITALGINDSRYRLGLYYTLFTIPFILYFYFRDKSRQERFIEESELDWTIIRPAQFIPGKKRSIYKHGHKVGHYILTKLITRADVAHFMLRELANPVYLNQKPGISY